MAWPDATYAAIGNNTGAVTANNVSATTTLAPTAPAGRSPGDLLVLVTVSRGISAAAATPSNWNAVSGFPVTSATTSGGKIYMFTRIADGTSTDDASFNWTSLTSGTSGDSAQAVILAVDYATETLDGSLATKQDQASTTSFTINACSPSFANSIWIGVAMRVNDTAHTFTVATLTERYDAHTTTGTGHGLLIGTKDLTAAGSTGTATVTPSNTTSSRTLTTAVCFQAMRGDPTFPFTIAAQAPPPRVERL